MKTDLVAGADLKNLTIGNLLRDGSTMRWATRLIADKRIGQCKIVKAFSCPNAKQKNRHIKLKFDCVVDNVTSGVTSGYFSPRILRKTILDATSVHVNKLDINSPHFDGIAFAWTARETICTKLTFRLLIKRQ